MTKPAKIFFLTCLICFVAIGAVGQNPRAKQQGGQVDGAKLLELGDYYYRSNDISDAADRYYQQAIRSSPGSQTAGYAQYNRANYWFRKFYVIQEQYSKPDYSALSQAERHRRRNSHMSGVELRGHNGGGARVGEGRQEVGRLHPRRLQIEDHTTL